jgi:hypothetical protein
MAVRRATPTSIDEYIAATPAEVRPILERIRRIVRAAAPGAEELNLIKRVVLLSVSQASARGPSRSSRRP